MITFLRGRLTSALPTQAVVDVNGLGYEVFIPLSSYDKLPVPGEAVHILTHLHVREDAQILYGFMSAAERDLFRLLVNHVSGIGPKLALAVLSGMSVSHFKSAVVNSDVALAFEDQRARQKDGGKNCSRTEGQGWGRGRVGSGQRGASADAARGAGE